MRPSASLASSLALAAAVFSSTVPAFAADRTGEYSVRGAGAQRCAAYVEAVEGNKPELGAYVGYIDGALTATSRLTPNVFDVNPFILPGSFAAIVMNICKATPDRLFDIAVRAGIEAITRARVANTSPVLEMVVEPNRMNLRSETLRAVQARLKTLNLFRGEPDGRWGPATQDALKRYQEANRMPVTSLPDPDTVLALLVRQP